MKPMRTAMILLAVCPLTAIIDARPSGAETYRPWCVQYSGRSGARSCASAGPGTGGSCVQNPWYLWYGPNSPSTTGRGGRARR